MTNTTTTTKPTDRNKMLDTTTTTLAIALVVQIGLAFALKHNATTYGAFQANKPLISADLNKATDIFIREMKDAESTPGSGSTGSAAGSQAGDSAKKKEQELALHKDGARWLIPEYHNFPASPDTLKRLLDSLKNLKRTLPVATTADAATRFKVSPHDYERSITFNNGRAPLAAMYVGTSPAFRKSNVRVDPETEIFTVDFSEHDLSTDPTDWIDRDAAAVKGKEIAKAEMPGYSVELKNGKWFLIENGQSTEISYHVAEEVFDKVGALSISEILDDTATGASAASSGTPAQAGSTATNGGTPAPVNGSTTSSTPPATKGGATPASGPAGQPFFYTITLRNGKTLAYTLTQPAGKNYYVLKVGGSGSTLAEYNLKVDSWYVDDLKKVTVKSLKEEWQAEQAHKKADAIPASQVTPKTAPAAKP